MKDLLLPFLTMPGLIITCLIVLLFFVSQLRRKTTLVLLCVLVFAGWSLSTVAFGRTISSFLIAQIDGAVTTTPQEADLIVVLTGGMVFTGDTGWLPKQESYRRAAVAFQLQSQVGSRTPVLISGGHTYGVQYPSEAEVTKTFFDRRNAQLTPTILEEFSTNTYENSLQTSFIVRKRQARGMFLVTSEVHMWRALATFRGRGIDAIPFPVISVPRGKLLMQDYLPTWEGAMLTSKALYELYGITLYLLTGKINYEDL